MNEFPHGSGEMARRIREHDWAATPLGPIEHWPPGPRAIVDLMLASGHAMQLAWGAEGTVLYNDAYAAMLGARHPRALGMKLSDVWPDVWSETAPLVARVLGGETVRLDDIPLAMTQGHDSPRRSFSCSPVRDESGRVIGLLNVTVDAVAAQAERERDDANARLRENEERFRALVTAGAKAIFIYRMSPDWRLMYELDSQTLASTQGPLEDWADKYILGDDRALVFTAIEAAIRATSVFELEHRVRLADGSIGWVLSRAVPLLDAQGRVREWFGAGSDVTERRQAVEALRDSEERFRQFAEASAAALWIREAGTLALEYVSPAISTMYGIEPNAFLGDIRRWAARIVPEDRDVALSHIERARAGEAVVHEFRIQRPSDQAFRWIRDTDFPLLDGQGQVQRIGGIAEDVTEAKLAIEHQAVLLAELQHRVRNIMAVIRTMAYRTADGAKSVEDYQSLLEGRLLALARVQTLLTREANVGGSLRQVIESEVSAQAPPGAHVTFAGPEIELSPKSVEVLTLAVHELSTNALKYGAFSVPEGRLSVSWRGFEKGERAWLALDWTEEGAPPRAASSRRGFGSDLIEGRIAYELGGAGKITIDAQGARCHLEFPLEHRESILETRGPVVPTVFGGTLDIAGGPDLSGRKILVVEDDYYLAGDTAAALRGAGAEVLGPCPTTAAVLDLLATETPTHAVVDLNLGGSGPELEVARLLKARGVSFLFLTGYNTDAIAADFGDVPLLSKPLPLRKLVEAVGAL